MIHKSRLSELSHTVEVLLDEAKTVEGESPRWVRVVASLQTLRSAADAGDEDATEFWLIEAINRAQEIRQ